MRTRLSKLDIHTVQDLIFHLPTRYEDRSFAVPISELCVGEAAVVRGKIIQHAPAYRRNRSQGLVCALQDDMGDTLYLEFMHATPYQHKALSQNNTVQYYGVVRRSARGLCMYHPEHVPIEQQENTHSLTPIYPSTKGFNQPLWRKIIALAMAQPTAGELYTTLPVPTKTDLAMAEHYKYLDTVSIHEALHYLHAPTVKDDSDAQSETDRYRRRLVFEELVAHYVCTQLATQVLQNQPAVAFEKQGDDLERALLKNLPFQLTKAQRRAVSEISADLGRDKAMRRLLQGDVGSGKTIVAALVALRVIASGAQVALMAPTEILMEQHYKSFTSWFGSLSLKTAQLCSTQTAKQRADILEELAAGNIDIIIGTHTLLQKDVRFKQLGLNIIDEQHLFGVHQRFLLQQKAVAHHSRHKPHQLIMTATPIPRTLFMMSYSGLSSSVIDELPAGRQPIRTVLVSQKRRDKIIERVHQACAQNNQAYWVCPLIDQTEAIAGQAVEDVAATLEQRMPGLRIGLLHSKCKPGDRMDTMQAFRNGDIHLLVATTIIGVGVDVPRASLMVIDNAERLGLAQLHQLRGRIGRGTQESYCVLLYGNCSKHSLHRLNVLREHSNGYMVAEQDLKIRGPGEVPGTPQSGAIKFKLADLQQDAMLIEPVQHYGDWLKQTHPKCVDVLIKRWRMASQIYRTV